MARACGGAGRRGLFATPRPGARDGPHPRPDPTGRCAEAEPSPRLDRSVRARRTGGSARTQASPWNRYTLPALPRHRCTTMSPSPLQNAHTSPRRGSSQASMRTWTPLGIDRPIDRPDTGIQSGRSRARVRMRRTTRSGSSAADPVSASPGIPADPTRAGSRCRFRNEARRSRQERARPLTRRRAYGPGRSGYRATRAEAGGRTTRARPRGRRRGTVRTRGTARPPDAGTGLCRSRRVASPRRPHRSPHPGADPRGYVTGAGGTASARVIVSSAPAAISSSPSRRTNVENHDQSSSSAARSRATSTYPRSRGNPSLFACTRKCTSDVAESGTRTRVPSARTSGSSRSHTSSRLRIGNPSFNRSK